MKNKESELDKVTKRYQNNGISLLEKLEQQTIRRRQEAGRDE
jgi:hypothetical protein